MRIFHVLLLAVSIRGGQTRSCDDSFECTEECGLSCMSECEVIQPEQAAAIRKAQECRWGSGQCRDEDLADVETCYLDCEAQCGTSNAWNSQGCVEICEESCQALSPQGTVRLTTEDESEDAFDVDECVKLCSIATECPALDEKFQFDVRKEATLRVPDKSKEVPVGDLSEAEKWNIAGSPERVRLEEALKDPESVEAQRFATFIQNLQGLQADDTGGFDEEDLASFFQGLDPEVMGEYGSEEEVMRMMQELLSGGMMGYDPYSDMGGESGYGDYEDYGEYQDDF